MGNCKLGVCCCRDSNESDRNAVQEQKEFMTWAKHYVDFLSAQPSSTHLTNLKSLFRTLLVRKAFQVQISCNRTSTETPLTKSKMIAAPKEVMLRVIDLKPNSKSDESAKYLTFKQNSVECI